MDIQRNNLLEHFEFVFETAPICSPEMSDDTRILSHKQQGCLGLYCHQPCYVHHHGNTPTKNDVGHNEQSDWLFLDKTAAIPFLDISPPRPLMARHIICPGRFATNPVVTRPSPFPKYFVVNIFFLDCLFPISKSTDESQYGTVTPLPATAWSAASRLK
jgi:hypothetical protein